MVNAALFDDEDDHASTGLDPTADGKPSDARSRQSHTTLATAPPAS